MEPSLKRMNHQKQVKMLNRLEKLNKSEMFALQRKYGVLDKERECYKMSVFREKKAMMLKLKDIQRNSGHSIMSIEPDKHDKAIRESTLLKSGIVFSEKQFLNWKLKEQSVQKQYKIKELEDKKERDREKELIEMLKKLNIITEKMTVFEPNETDEDVDRVHQEKYPLTDKLFRNRLKVRYDRPVSVDCSSIKRHYIEQITRPTSVSNNMGRKISRRVSFITKPTVANFQNRRIKSAKVNWQNTAEKEENLRVKKISVEKVAEVVSRPKTSETGNRVDSSDDDILLSGFAKLPKWKRQLMMEAPIGLNDTISAGKVQVIMSQAQKRKDLEDMIASNLPDVETITKEKDEKLKKEIETMKKTLKEMDELEQLNIEVE